MNPEWTNSRIEAAARVIVATRDFCGDEREAFADFCIENGLDNNGSARGMAFACANTLWRKSQVQAGVKPKYRRY